MITLMYHAIIGDGYDPAPERETGAHLYDVAAMDFLGQMRFLSEQGLRVSTGEDEAGEPPDVVLTFDDGEASNFYNAFPVLRKYGFKAYFFVTPARVGQPGYMNWEQVLELREEGMLIGSHGLTHKILVGLSPRELARELRDSKDVLEQHLNVPVETLSIPRGFVNEQVMARAWEAGYKKVFVSGPAKIKGTHGRVAVKGRWDLNRFKMALEGKVPAREELAEVCKQGIKSVFGGRGYDKLRGMILRVRSGK